MLKKFWVILILVSGLFIHISNSNGSETLFLCLSEGNPGIPGDGIIISTGDVDTLGVDFELQSPYPLSGIMNGLTVSAFPPTGVSLTGLFFQTQFIVEGKTNFQCGFAISFAPNEIVKINFNGVGGIAASISQDFFDFAVDLQSTLPGCEDVTLDKLLLHSVILFYLPDGFVLELDALAVGVGENTFPTEMTPIQCVEGSPGDTTCSDGIDNDGDGLTDLDDVDCTAFLSFPLKGSRPGVDEGLTPYTATINSVFDHSQLSPYDASDNVVTAYTGDKGKFVKKDPVQDCKSKVLSKNYGFKNEDGGSFNINDHYSGGGDTCPTDTKCDPTCSTFLFYDGHPGYDYRASGGINCPSKDTGTEVYAVADGYIHYPNKIPGLSNAEKYRTLELDPDGMPEYKIYYLHLSTHPNEKNEIISEGVHVNRGEMIGRTGCGGGVPPHLHFEVQKNGIPVDPYGWEGGTICPDCDPYSLETNVLLWK